MPRIRTIPYRLGHDGSQRQTLVKKELFREDLDFRLNVITIGLPPLRDRGDDVLLLIHHFGEKFAKELGRSAPKFSDEALRVLRNYHWPGNVGELENVYNPRWLWPTATPLRPRICRR